MICAKPTPHYTHTPILGLMVPKLRHALDFAHFDEFVGIFDIVSYMFYKIQIILISVCLSGCASVLLAPATVAGAAAEQKTGKSPISSLLSRVTGEDCDVKRVLKADYPCKPLDDLVVKSK